jgi:hypothetical protein
MLKRLTVVALAIALTASLSGLALAAEEDDPDTMFSWAYDLAWRVLLWNVALSSDDCGFDDGEVTVIYNPTGTGLDVDHAGADDNCALSGGSVEGPNGQINHGMFMKTFNSLWDGEGGRGCVIRHLAQSDLGKGDQQVRVPDVDPDPPQLEQGDTGEVPFESVVTECRRGNGDKVTGQDKAAEKRAEQEARKAEREAAKADKVRGKSASAPGRNR